MNPFTQTVCAAIVSVLLASSSLSVFAQTSSPCSAPPIPDGLQLSADQSRAWKAADNDMVRDFELMSSSRRQQQGGAATTSSVSIDLHAQGAAMRTAEADALRFNEANRTRWLAVFDLLSTEQKRLASVGLLRRMTFSECPLAP